MNRLLLLFIIAFFPLFKVKWYYNLWFFIALLLLSFIFSSESKFRSYNKPSRNDLLYVLFVITCLVSDAFNNCLSIGWNYVVSYSLCFLFYFVLKCNLNSYKVTRQLTLTLFLTLGIVVFIVIMQFLGVQAFFMSDVDKFNGNTNFEEAKSSFEIRYWGPFTSSLILSTFFVSLSCYFFSYLMCTKSKGWVKLLTFLAFAGLILSTGSRSGFIIFLFSSLFIYKQLKGFSIKFWLSLSLIVVGTIYFASNFIQQSYFYSRLQNSDSDYRYVVWTHIGDLFLLNPVLGVGAWNLNTHLKDLNILPGFIDKNNLASFGHIENTYFTVLTSTGIIGFFFFISFLLGPFYRNKKNVSTLYSPFINSSKYAYISILLCAFFEPSLLGSSSILLLLFIFRAILQIKSTKSECLSNDLYSNSCLQPFRIHN
jgi:O-antigen ligase